MTLSACSFVTLRSRRSSRSKASTWCLIGRRSPSLRRASSTVIRPHFTLSIVSLTMRARLRALLSSNPSRSVWRLMPPPRL